MNRFGKTARNLTLLVLITLLFSVSIFIIFNQQTPTQNTLTFPTQPTSPTTKNSKMGTHLQLLLQTSDPSTEYEMIIIFQKTINYTQGISLLENLGSFEIISNYTILNGICIKAPIEMARTIALQNYVKTITYNEKIKLIPNQATAKEIQTKDTTVNDAIGASTLRSTYGLNGTGVVVAVLDTGINPHIYLSASRINYSKSFVENGTYSEDEKDYNGHGTHVAGIIGASGGTAIGVAPNVTFLNLKVLDKDGYGQLNWLLSAIDEALKKTPLHPKADIISLSLGDPNGKSFDDMSKAVNSAWTDNDTIVVAAAGNEGGNGWSVNYQTINSPGLGAYIITVGATGGPNYRSVSYFSSRGPTDDHRAKPDIVAPGEGITTLEKDGVNIIKNFGGTSASTPVVSGAIALLLDKNKGMPWLSPNTTKAALMLTAEDLGDNPFAQGAGLINISRAFHYLQDYYIHHTVTTPPLIITPIRALTEPMTINELNPTILNLTIVVGNITTTPIINAYFNVSGNATAFTTVPTDHYPSLNDTQEFVQVSFIAPPGASIYDFSGNLTFINGSGTILFTIPLSLTGAVPLWFYLLPLFYSRDQAANLLAVGGIAGIAAIAVIGLAAAVWATRRKPEAPPEFFEYDWGEGPPPPPPPDYFY
nr:S8 family serine peptidase [Candidatus Freyarchaeota archaeon]